jgi:hypothetical protein
MSKHRKVRSGVSSELALSRGEPFSPADALESLHSEVVQLEVFAHLAAEVITRLSPPPGRDQRRDYIRLYALVSKVADDAIALVGHGDALITALSKHLAGHAHRSDSVSLGS